MVSKQKTPTLKANCPDSKLQSQQRSRSMQYSRCLQQIAAQHTFLHPAHVHKTLYKMDLKAAVQNSIIMVLVFYCCHRLVSALKSVCITSHVQVLKWPKEFYKLSVKISVHVHEFVPHFAFFMGNSGVTISLM